VTELKIPALKSGSKVEAYVFDLHKKIWELCEIIEPELTGDCLEVATKVIKKHETTTP
jgi:hypothetical protein